MLITLLFLDFTGTLHAWFGFLAKIQFLPALLALNFGVVAALIVLTLLFGRVYCSVICPLGVMQDAVSWIAGKRTKNRFRYSPTLSWLRYGVLALFIAAAVAGIGSFVALLAPYSAYGRIVSNLIAPLYLWGNNLLAYLAERAGSYAFYRADVWMKGIATLAVAAGTFIILAVVAWRNGRTYCNTICPVGTVLGLFSRFSLLAPVIDTCKCNRLRPVRAQLQSVVYRPESAPHRPEPLCCLHGLHREMPPTGNPLPIAHRQRAVPRPPCRAATTTSKKTDPSGNGYNILPDTTGNRKNKGCNRANPIPTG